MNKVFSFILIIFCFFAMGFKNDKPIKFYEYKKGIYIVEIDTQNQDLTIEPYVSENLETIEEMVKKTNAKIAINTGFFDPKNEKTISFIVKNKEIIANPYKNTNFVKNKSLEKYINKIVNRSEFRVLENGKFDIKQKNETSKNIVLHSIQAGPELYPTLKLQEESFIERKNGKIIRHSAGALNKHSRSAIGIKNNRIILVAVSNDCPLTLLELSKLMKKLKVNKAMAFDGGSSTSLFVDIDKTNKPFLLYSAKNNQARKIKSALIIK